jgi:hypothetical protein
MTKKIPYNQDLVRLRHEWSGGDDYDDSYFPRCKISISDTSSGSVIVDAQAAEQYGSAWAFVYLYSAASAGDASISLDPGAIYLPRPGDRFEIASSDAGPAEVAQIKYFDSSTDTFYLERELVHAHSAGANCRPLFFTYEIDTATDIDDYPLGRELQVMWRVEDYAGYYNTNLSSSDLYVVANQVYDSGAIKEHFRDIYSRVYDIIEPRWDRIEDEAYRRIKNYIGSKGRDIDTLTDKDVLRPAMIEQIYILGAPRTDEFEYERSDAKAMMDGELIRLEQLPIWFDEDQDNIKDETEIMLTAWEPHGRYM